MVNFMTINILTLFPDFFTSPLASSILGRAQEQNQVEFNLVDIRDFTTDKHRVTDQPPYGGGPGMVMKVEPIDRALADLTDQGDHFELAQKDPRHRIILTSAKGKQFNQQLAQNYSQLNELTVICGHYEGVDERVAQHLVDEEVRIGDYVLTGGEPAALVMADAVTRLIPNVLGNAQSNVDESHSKPGQLAYPQYTRPREYRDWQVPTILLSGDHQKIEAWRQEHQKIEKG
jgi:tRNA (guanine37-N1)-methyltransferase